MGQNHRGTEAQRKELIHWLFSVSPCLCGAKERFSDLNVADGTTANRGDLGYT